MSARFFHSTCLHVARLANLCPTQSNAMNKQTPEPWPAGRLILRWPVLRRLRRWIRDPESSCLTNRAGGPGFEIRGINARDAMLCCIVHGPGWPVPREFLSSIALGRMG